MRPPGKSRGSGAVGLLRILILVVVGFMLISRLPGCAQQLGQMAGNSAAPAASRAAGGAGNPLSRLGQDLIDGLESWWGGLSPEEKFDKVCEQVPVEGVDKLCPYFTAALKGASDRDAAESACYMAAAGIGGEGPQTLDLIHRFCRQTPGDPSAFATCVRRYVEPGNASRCLGDSPEQFWRAAHTMIEPIACPPGTPKSWCTTQSSSQPSSASPGAPGTSEPNTSSSTRTDTNYLNCLGYYYAYLRPRGQASCGSSITAANAGCARAALLGFTYQGQSVGATQVSRCDGMQP
jgi:hypothetical protein